MSITLSGHQLKSLLEFANPDGDNDLDQLETELTIAFVEDGHSGKGYYFWMTEYPEEGCMFLDDLDQKSVNKYNWSLIPEHVQFMATDEDGKACGWLVEPRIMGNAWRHQAHLSAFFNITARDNYLNHFQGDWKESLEKRPEEQSQ
ncbi:conserved hypothetical protein [Acinetobacter proteolyticus]|uniref:Uncharacterized protein n=1 Tax=Acinetobacter proteolyticus TaxID=1776741 RepID=A0A653K543_9GAMM|nr:hypothetical protein [Acinetobacter proteolyticus]VXA55453.1 conserved hypothetical protein [Acinetobacter proteolyticus]